VRRQAVEAHPRSAALVSTWDFQLGAAEHPVGHPWGRSRGLDGRADLADV
jgi:hypothetical protein